MIESSIEDDVLVHRVTGSLDLPDIIHGMFESRATLPHPKSVRAIVWDLSDALYDRQAGYFATRLGPAIQLQRDAHPTIPRSIITDRLDEAEKVLTDVDPAWPWQVTSSRADAIEWIERHYPTGN